MEQQSLSATRLLNACRAATRWSLVLLFFLVPVFFLPWTIDALEINKQAIFVILTSVAAASWLASMVLGKRFSFRSGWWNVLPPLLIAAALVSSVLSLSGYQGWVGTDSQEYTSFLSIALFVVMLYVLANAAGETAVQRNILTALLLSSALAGVVTLLGTLNVFHLPFDFTQAASFNPIGTVNGFIAFMTVVMFLGLAAWLVSDGPEGVFPPGARAIFMRVLVVINTVIALIFLAAIDFWLFWLLAIVGALLLIAFAFIQASAIPKPARFFLPFFVLIVSVLLLFFQSPVSMQLPIVVTPSYRASWDISRQVLSQGPVRLLFGSGPGTFASDYALYKSADVNATSFWNARLDRARSHGFTVLATFGVVGTVVSVLFAGWLFVRSLSRLLFERDHEEWRMTYVIFVGWTLVTLLHVLYASNFTLHFLFWGLAGLLASQVAGVAWHSDVVRSPRVALGASFAFVVAIVGFVSVLYVVGARSAAEMAFAKAVRLDRDHAPIAEIIRALSTATTRNPLSDILFRNAGSALLADAYQRIQAAGDKELASEEAKQIQALVAGSVEAGRRAVTLEPNNVANWVMLGSIYRDLMPFVSDAQNFAVASFSRAAALEPANPIHQTNLGRVYLVLADRASKLKTAKDKDLADQAAKAEPENLAAAEAAFSKAVDLKGDYAPAHYYLAAVFERQGRIEEAAARLAALVKVNRGDIGLGFQLGLLYLRLEKLDQARAEFERILVLNPDYSNALWYLATVYEEQGQKQKAIELVGKVKALNPGNQSVEERLTKLRTGATPTSVLLPVPIEEGTGDATRAESGQVTE